MATVVVGFVPKQEGEAALLAAIEEVRQHDGRLIVVTALRQDETDGEWIAKTQADFVGSLQSLAPAVEQLTATGSDLVKALKIAGTFPFPLGKTLTAVKGDYANLHLYINLDLTNQLCGLSKVLCKANIKAPKPASESTQDLSGPTLVGAGR